MKKSIGVVILLMFISVSMLAQTINCNVVINNQKLQSTNRDFFQEMKNTISDFVNNRTWADYQLEPYERIECNFIITLNEQLSENDFKGTLQIQAQRPVYNSAYKSPTLNTIDNDFEFRFSQNEVLDFSEMSHSSNLASLLAYWINIVLGIDFDTFSLQGGTPFFRRAERIVQNAQGESKPGWNTTSGSGRKNRYWLVENILSPKYSKEREAYYKYHRLGLDVMGENAEQGRESIKSALVDMQTLYREKPDNTLHYYIMFFDAKADEIVNVFSESSTEEKQEVYKLLNEINTTNEPKYKKLR